MVALAAPAASGAGEGPPAADRGYVSQLLAAARARRIADDRGWLTLLHYRRIWNGRWRSEADGVGFFLSGRAGKTDPVRELEATLTALAAPPRALDPARPEASQHPQCRFPARWAWLKRTLAIDPARFPDQPCPLFGTWRQGMAAETVTLVYAAAYLNSPASMYGHTFFRLSRATGEGNPLLDYILNFAADIDTRNGLVYAVKGMTGGFRGHFYAMPYYMKIQEYSNIESRDLWEYELALQPDEIERLVAHAWETRSTHFDYYFASENCSYFLLALLEAAAPRLHLVRQFDSWVIPSDTVRAVLQIPGLVRNSVGRPSLRAAMMARKARLEATEIAAADALASSGRSAAPVIAPLAPRRQAVVMDAAYDRLRYREGFSASPTPRFARIERDLLVLRGRTGVPPQAFDVAPDVDAPERGHRTLRVALGGGMANQAGDAAPRPFVQFGLRLAIHDHLDPPRGYVEDAVLEMAHLIFRVDEKARAPVLERADAINIVSPVVFDRWVPKLSWRVRVGGEQLRALGCGGWRCFGGGVTTGSGLATRLGRRLLTYAMAESEALVGATLANRYRVGLGGSVAMVLRIARWWQLDATARYLHHFLGDTRRHVVASGGQAFSLGSRAQLRLLGDVAGGYRAGRAELVAYF